MKKNNDNKILKNSQNYAAIYARVSTTKDNNSIEAQIDKAKNALSKRGLLVYASYMDHVSGRTIPPHKREGFSKLLQDAELGFFKTIVAYKHDRVVRSLKDWIELKNHLDKMGVNLIFSDDSEYTSDNSLQGVFLENLLIMVGELEPNRINERTKSGMQRRREQGIYHGPKDSFGYTSKTQPTTNPKDNSEKVSPKNPKDSSDVVNAATKYQIVPLQEAFVKYLYITFDEFIKNNTAQIKNVINDIKSFFTDLYGDLSSIGIQNLEDKYKDSDKSILIKAIKNELSENEQTESLKCRLDEIKKHLSLNTNIQTILKGSIYGGCMLIDAKQENMGIITELGISTLDKISYVNTINIFKIIDDYHLFERVYCYANLTFIPKDEEPEYLFKGKFKCREGTIMHLTDNLVCCNHVETKQKCKYYSKINLISSTLEVILDDVFSYCNVESNTKNGDDIKGFNKFSAHIEEKLYKLENEIIRLRKSKIEIMENYFRKKNSEYVDDIYLKENELTAKLRKVAEYHKELGYITKLKDILRAYYNSHKSNELGDDNIEKIKSNLITYIISNSDFFNNIFKNIISEIQVNTIEHENNAKCEFKINYNFCYKDNKKNSGIYESIH